MFLLQALDYIPCTEKARRTVSQDCFLGPLSLFLMSSKVRSVFFFQQQWNSRLWQVVHLVVHSVFVNFKAEMPLKPHRNHIITCVCSQFSRRLGC